MARRTLALSRSQIAARRRCEQYRYWEYDWGGHGLSKMTVALPLAGGIGLHDILARILILFKGDDYDTVMSKLRDVQWVVENIDPLIAAGIADYKRGVLEAGLTNMLPEHLDHTVVEQAFLLEMLVRGWLKFRLPDIVTYHEIIDIEQEYSVRLTPEGEVYVVGPDDEIEGIDQQIRFDVVLRRRSDGVIVILDFKTHAYEREGWVEKLRIALQTLLYVSAGEQIYGEHVAGVQYEGLFKGRRAKSKAKQGRFIGYKLQESFLVYGYTDGALWQPGYTARKGWSKAPVWETMDARTWMAQLDQEAYRNLYQTVLPHRPTPVEQERARAQVIKKELEWQVRISAGTGLSGYELVQWMEFELERNDDACLIFGSDNRCAFWDLCYDRDLASRPLEAGYVPRQDHHAIPEEGKESTDDA